jgi:DNA repair protein RecO (recombination protein O)
MFSEDLGKVTAIAKGAKRSKKRFVNKLEIFSKISIQYKISQKSTLLFLHDAELENAHISLRYNPHSFIVATYLAELITKFTREHDQDIDIFKLLEWAYGELNHTKRPTRTAALFHLKLLTLVGYQPQVDSCAYCEQPLNSRPTYTLQPGNGAIACSFCTGNNNGYNRTIPLQTLKFMGKAISLDPSRITRLTMPHQVVREILQILYVYSRHLLQQDFHSWKLLYKDMQAG